MSKLEVRSKIRPTPRDQVIDFNLPGLGRTGRRWFILTLEDLKIFKSRWVLAGPIKLKMKPRHSETVWAGRTYGVFIFGESF